VTQAWATIDAGMSESRRISRPRAVAFDVMETLFSMNSVAVALREAGLEEHRRAQLMPRLLRDGFALAASGAYRPFRDVADAALAAIAPELDAPARHQVFDAFGSLDAHPDAQPALERFTQAGVPVATLTNGSAVTTNSLLARAGLAELVGSVISVDDVQMWKPAPAPYRHAADVLGVAPGELALVAVHSWDVHGAHHAGLVTGWASRLEGTFPATFTPPDVSGADLVDVAGRLLALAIGTHPQEHDEGT
jgi:2-haloacid dehalogenase